MRRSYPYICLLLFLASRFAAQHGGHYSQYMFNQVLLNPAYAGSHDALKITALYRSQWVGVDGAPRQLSFAAHSPLKNQRLNAGLIIENQQLGLYSGTSAAALYAYRFPFAGGKLSFGLQAGAESNQLNRDHLRVRDGDDPVYTHTVQRQTRLMAGTGVFYLSERFYAGFALPRLLPSNGTGVSLMQAHAGALLRLSEDLQLKPAAVLKKISGSPMLTNLSATFYYREIAGAGGGFTFRNSWFALIDLRITEQLNFGYAYERSVGPIAGFNNGSHEIMLRYLFRYRIGAVNPRYF